MTEVNPDKIVVIKRDGKEVPFCVDVIETAIGNAAAEAAEVVDVEFIVGKVLKRLKSNVVAVEDIQDTVVHALMVSKYKTTAEFYIKYRTKRDQNRELKENLFADVDSLINQNGADLLTENANKDPRIIPTIKNLVSESVGKHYARKYILPSEVVSAHDAGEIHVHDIGEFLYPIFNCMLIDLDNMLKGGFHMGNAHIESPTNILTACSVAAQVVTAVGSHIYGGNTLPWLDKTLKPYVTKTYNKYLLEAEVWVSGTDDDLVNYAKAMTLRDIKSGIQALYYQLNTIVSSQGQTVFSSLTCGEGTSWEERAIQEAMLNQQYEGLGKDKTTFTFPKLIFQVRKGVNFYETDPNYDMFKLAAKCSAKRLYPDIQFMDTIQEKVGTQAVSMGCRSFLAPWEDEKGDTIYAGRNNLGVVTVNPVRCALKASGGLEVFWEEMERVCRLAKLALDARIKRFEGVKASVAPILYCSGAMGVRLGMEDEVSDLFKNGRSSISLGYIGIDETVRILTGKDIKGNAEDLGIEIVKFLHDKTKQWRLESGYAYSTYSTPAENLCYRFCKLDTEIFGEVEGVTTKGYYTNSFHRTVTDKLNFAEKAEFESPYPSLASGGFIMYGEYPRMVGKEDALLASWKYVSEYAPYWGTNLPSDQCFKCGFEGEFTAHSSGFSCPSCGNGEEGTVSVIRRITGYLGSTGSRPVNKGKHKEMQLRVKHY